MTKVDARTGIDVVVKVAVALLVKVIVGFVAVLVAVLLAVFVRTVAVMTATIPLQTTPYGYMVGLATGLPFSMMSSYFTGFFCCRCSSTLSS